MWGLHTLHHLFLHHTGLEKIPPEVSALTSLSILDISANHLTDIPKELGKCDMLSRINASHNKLSSLPDDLDELRELVELDLSSNQFETLPPVLSYIKEVCSFSCWCWLLWLLWLLYLRYCHVWVGEGLVPSPKANCIQILWLNMKRVEILLDRNPLNEPLDEASHPHQWVNSTRFNYDAAEMLGRRPTMEDAFALRGTFMGTIFSLLILTCVHHNLLL